MKIKFEFEKIFYWLLGMSAATIPVPGYQYNSISIILLFIFWLFFGSFHQKFRILKENKLNFLIMLIPFLLAVFGLIYTNDLNTGIRKIQILLPFLIYPLVLLSIPYKKDTSRFVLYCFSFGTLLASLFGVGRAAYYRWNSLGDYFYYLKFSELIDKHTTYFSLFAVISCLFITRELLKRKLKLILGVPAIIFLLGVLNITSTRISLIALLVSGFLLILLEIKSKYKWLVLFLPLLLFGLYFSPNFQKRFEPSETELGAVNDMEFREYHWKSVFETIENNSILFGSGTGGNRDFLYQTYKKYHLTSAYELEYNAHNQFLEIVLDYGLVGLFVFILMLAMLIFRFFKSKNYFGLAMMTVFLIYFMTESLFQRQDGVVSFSLIITILFCKNISFNQKESK